MGQSVFPRRLTPILAHTLLWGFCRQGTFGHRTHTALVWPPRPSWMPPRLDSWRQRTIGGSIIEANSSHIRRSHPLPPELHSAPDSGRVDHKGDGGQMIAGLADVPNGLLCDNGSPTGCNYMQCGPGRSALLTTRRYGIKNKTTAVGGDEEIKPWQSVSKHQESIDRNKEAEGSGPLGDTAAVGHDWIIEGTLAGRPNPSLDPNNNLNLERDWPAPSVAGSIMKAEMLLASRNRTGAQLYLPIFKATSDFVETRS